MKTKRYTITFNPKLRSIDQPLKEIEQLGIEIQSAQRFIGTAVVAANPEQLKRVRAVADVAGVTETGTIKAI